MMTNRLSKAERSELRAIHSGNFTMERLLDDLDAADAEREQLQQRVRELQQIATCQECTVDDQDESPMLFHYRCALRRNK